MSAWAIIGVSPAAAVLGAYLGRRLRVPAGLFVGAMVGVGAWLAVLGLPEVRTPPLLNQVLQIMVGVVVGFRVSADALRAGARSLFPAAVLAALFLFSGMAAAAAVFLTGISPVTALFAAAPGGLTEMASVGTSLGADGPAVAAIHLVRLLLVIFAAGAILGRIRSSGRERRNPQDEPEAAEAASPPGGMTRLLVVAGAGLVGGAIGLAFTPLPAGGVVGSLLSSGLARLLLAGGLPEKNFNAVVQVFAGAVIGLGLSAEFFRTLAQLAGAALVINTAQMLVWVGAGYLLTRAFRFDPQTAALAAAPGGMGTLIAMTGDTDADLVTVAFTHLFRLTATIVAVPLIAASFF